MSEELVYTVQLAIPIVCNNPECNGPVKRLVHQQQKGDNTKEELENRYHFVCIKCSKEIMKGMHR